MKSIHLDAKTISDAWFQLIYNLPDYGYYQHIQRGSFEGEKRLQYPGVSVDIEYPWQDMVPIMPEGMGIPAPTTMDYIQEYFVNYLMGDVKAKGEQYTYGERIKISLNRVIEILSKTPETNQAIVEVAEPLDILLKDPPCLRLLDFKVLPAMNHDAGNLSVTAYYRSWDLWAGFPSNLGGLELLKQYVAHETGTQNGSMYAYSAGLHLYGFHENIAKIRTMRDWQKKEDTRGSRPGE